MSYTTDEARSIIDALQQTSAYTGSNIENLEASAASSLAYCLNRGIGVTENNNVVDVYDSSDFPDPVEGVITLADSTVYSIKGEVDISNNRLVVGSNTTIRGNSPALDFISSSTTEALITATNSFRLFELGLTAPSGSILDLNGSGSEICFCVGIKFFGGGTLGTVDQYDLFEINIGLLVGFSEGFTITGANGSLILVDVEFFQTSGTPTSLDLNGATFNIVRILGVSFTVVDGAAGLVLAADGANINSNFKGIISSCSFTGAGTLITGYSALNEKWNVASINVGITPSDRFLPTGFGYYQDAESSPATQSLTTSFQKLQIDGAGAATETNFLPLFLRDTSGQLWDTTNDKITPISIGDSYNLRIDIEITATGGGVTALFLQLDIGGGASPSIVIVDRVISFSKSTPFTVSVGFPIFSGSTFLTNGGQIFIATDSGTATAASRGITIQRVSSGAITT